MLLCVQTTFEGMGSVRNLYFSQSLYLSQYGSPMNRLVCLLGLCFDIREKPVPVGWLLVVKCGVKLSVCFPCGILGQVWYMIVSIPDLCPLSYL